MSAREYTILFDAVRWTWYPRWLPFGTVHLSFEKETTWQEAHHMASRVLETGGWNVRVVPARGGVFPSGKERP